MKLVSTIEDGQQRDAVSHANELILKFCSFIFFCFLIFVFGKLVDKSQSRQCVDDFTSKSSLEYVRRFLILKVDKTIERDSRIFIYVWVLSNQSRKYRMHANIQTIHV